MSTTTAPRWGTWEELVLGSAVLRHGTAAWASVAGEVRLRTPFPTPFTPQACEAKYQDLQERYSKSDAWIEELRKRRIAELRRELEKSDEHIGFLQSKIEVLNAERGSVISNNSHRVPPSPSENFIALNSSVGNFTAEAESVKITRGSPENDPKVDFNLPTSWGTKMGRTLKKMVPCKRGDLCIIKEDSRVNMTSEDQNLGLAAIMDSIMEHEDVSILRQQVEIWKINARIGDGSIPSANELFKVLLMFAKKSLVAHPKNSPEQNSALVLCGLVNKARRKHLRSPHSGVGQSEASELAGTFGRTRGVGSSASRGQGGQKRELESINEGRKRGRRR